MMKNSLILALSLLVAAPSLGHGEDRYRNRPPVIVSPDLTAPWVLQLRGPVRQEALPARRQVREETAPVAKRKRRQPDRTVQPDARGLLQPVAMTRADRPERQIDPQYLPQTVAYETQEAPGTIVIDTNNRFLYLVAGNGEARRYGVGVGKPGFEWAGVHTVTRKAEWPTWNPPAEMRARESAKGHYLPARMDGGPANPLGARAMYLGSTLYRIHGTNAPWTIGYAVSSGCIRLRNEDVTDLYERVNVGAKVIVL